MSRSALYSEALAKTRAAYAQAPFLFPLESVIDQLEYLIAVDRGAAPGDRLSSISIGQIAARDIDEFDDELADLLHRVSAEVNRLLGEKGGSLRQ